MTRPHNYILDGEGQPIAVDGLLAWGTWFEGTVARDEIGDVTVDTVFLGIDHNFTFEGPPVLWETMIFGGTGDFDEYQERYTSREAAVEGGHARAVALVRSAA